MEKIGWLINLLPPHRFYLVMKLRWKFNGRFARRCHIEVAVKYEIMGVRVCVCINKFQITCRAANESNTDYGL